MKAAAVLAAAVAALVALVVPTGHHASTPATTTTTTTVQWREVCAVRIEWVPRGAGSVQAPTFDCHREQVGR